jgi:hypothetical protein
LLRDEASYRRVSSHRLHPLIGFEEQTDKSPPTWF